MSEPNSVKKIRDLAVEALDRIGVNPAAIAAAAAAGAGGGDVVTRVIDYVPASAAPNNTIGFVVLDATDNAVQPFADAESCTLPVGVNGKRITVKNIAQAYTLQVFPNNVNEDLGQGNGNPEILPAGIARTYIYLTNVGAPRWYDYNFLMRSINSYNTGLIAFGKQNLTSSVVEEGAEITSAYVNVNNLGGAANRVRLPDFATIAPSGIWGDVVVENGSFTEPLNVYPPLGGEIADNTGGTYGFGSPFTIPPGEIWTFRARNGATTYYLLDSNFEGTALNNIAASGTDYAGATNSKIVTQITRVTSVVPASAEGVVLPHAKKGRRSFIFNDTANALTVYASTLATTDTVDGTTDVSMIGGAKQWFVALDDNTWITE